MKFVSITKQDDEQQLVYAEVYAPMVVDAHGDFMTAEEIQKMAFNFLQNGLTKNVDLEHDNELTGSTIVESFIARKGDPDFVEGSWCVGVHISDALWPAVKSGEINGFSFQGKARRDKREIEAAFNPVVKGETAPSDGSDHIHKFTVHFDEATQKFLGGETNTVDGHSHLIAKGTCTEENAGHTHRFAYVDLMAKDDEEMVL